MYEVRYFVLPMPRIERMLLMAHVLFLTIDFCDRLEKGLVRQVGMVLRRFPIATARPTASAASQLPQSTSHTAVVIEAWSVCPMFWTRQTPAGVGRMCTSGLMLVDKLLARGPTPSR